MLLSLSFIAYASSHRYSNDTIKQMELDFLGNWQNISLPAVEIPEVDLPDIDLPDIKLPGSGSDTQSEE
jgi:hypothetical protein